MLILVGWIYFLFLVSVEVREDDGIGQQCVAGCVLEVRAGRGDARDEGVEWVLHIL